MSKAAFSRYRGLIHIPRPDNERAGVGYQAFQKSRQVVGIMLAIGINGNCIVITFLNCGSKTLLQGGPFSLVGGKG